MITNLIKILRYQVFVTLICGGLLALPQIRDSMSYYAAFLLGGSLFSAVNFAILYWVWAIVFTKKKIAPLVIAVVSKYAILGLVLWGLSPLAKLPMAFFVLGVLANSMALVLFGIIGKNKKTESQHVF